MKLKTKFRLSSKKKKYNIHKNYHVLSISVALPLDNTTRRISIKKISFFVIPFFSLQIYKTNSKDCVCVRVLIKSLFEFFIHLSLFTYRKKNSLEKFLNYPSEKENLQNRKILYTYIYIICYYLYYLFTYHKKKTHS